MKKHYNFPKMKSAAPAGVFWCFCETYRVSSGTLLLRAQLSWSWTDSGVEGPSGGAAVGAWLCGFRRLAWLLRLRELADDWWWLCGGGRGGRREVWLRWLDAPEREREDGDKSQNFSYTMLSAKCFRPQIKKIKLFRLLWFSATVICLLFSSHAQNVCNWKEERWNARHIATERRINYG